MWQFDCGATITLWAGEERQQKQQRHGKGGSALNGKGSLPSACAGAPRGRRRPALPDAAAARLTLNAHEMPCPALPVCWDTAAAEHTLSHLIAQAWPRSSAGAGNGSGAIPQTPMLLMHSEGKRSERTALLPDLVLEFEINISKRTILNSKDSLSLWYLLVPNFWNSPGLVAMLFCARFPLLCIGIKDRSEGSLQSHSTTCLLQIFFPKFSKSRT